MCDSLRVWAIRPRQYNYKYRVALEGNQWYDNLACRPYSNSSVALVPPFSPTVLTLRVLVPQLSFSSMDLRPTFFWSRTYESRSRFLLGGRTRWLHDGLHGQAVTHRCVSDESIDYGCTHGGVRLLRAGLQLWASCIVTKALWELGRHVDGIHGLPGGPLQLYRAWCWVGA